MLGPVQKGAPHTPRRTGRAPRRDGPGHVEEPATGRLGRGDEGSPARRGPHYAWRRAAALLAALAVLALLLAGTLQATGRIHLLSSPRRATTAPGAASPRGNSSPGIQTHPESTPHTLRVLTHPEGASLTIRGADGSVRAAGHTPFTGRVMGGELMISLAMRGRNHLTQQVLLD